MKRFWPMLIIVAMLLTAACAPKQEPPPPEAITLRIYVDGHYLWDPLIASFEDRYPHIRVARVFDPLEGDAARAARAESGELDLMPLFWDDRDERLFRPLDPFIQKSDLPLDRFNPPLSALRSHADGQIYALAVGVEPMVMLYNPQMFREAGVAAPRTGWTWEEFREAAVTLSRQGEPWGFFADTPMMVQELFRSKVEQASGGDWIDADEPILRDALAFFTSLIFTERAAPPLPERDWDRPGGRHREGNPFDDQQTAMSLEQGVFAVERFAWPAYTQKGRELGLVLLPAAPGHVSNREIMFKYKIGIPAASQQPEAAWLFLHHMVGPEGAAIIARHGELPLYQSDEVREAWFSREPAPPPGTAVLFETPWTVKKVLQQPDEVRDRLAFMLLANVYYALSGQMDPDTAIDDFLQERKMAGR